MKLQKNASNATLMESTDAKLKPSAQDWVSATSPRQRTRASGFGNATRSSNHQKGSVDPVSSNLFRSILVFSSALFLKSSENARIYFENVNGLPISSPSWRLSHKWKRLFQIIRRLNTDNISIAKTQINPSFLFNSKVVYCNLFTVEYHVDIVANNSTDFIGQR